jgi:hypothetical protein
VRGSGPRDLLLNRGDPHRQPLPARVPRPRSINDCGLCVHGFLHMVLLHDHATLPLVTTRDRVMHCTICHGRGMDLERAGFGHS